MDQLRLIFSELQLWDSSSKGTRDIWRGIEVSDNRMKAGGAGFPQREVLAEALVPFLSPLHRVNRWVLYLSLHHSSSHCLLHAGDSKTPPQTT